MDNSKVGKYYLTTDMVLTTIDGKKYILASPQSNVKDVEVMYINIFESIDRPYLLAELNITDVALNLIGEIPLQGMERITFGIQTPYFSDKEYQYDFRVYAIRNRYADRKIQNYTLDLISYEGLRNEATRVGKVLTGYGDQIAKTILKDYLSADIKINDSQFENCQFQMKFIPSNKRPFEVISDMLPKCVSSKASTPTSKTNVSGIKKPTTEISSATTNTPSKDTAENLLGSAGYCFWETQEGYKFKSIDRMCSNGQTFGGDPIKDTFKYQLANIEGRDGGKNILEYNYVDEINLLKKMRYGTYSSLMVFFNPSTGQYEEYVFDIDKSYPKMAHLGKDEKIPEGPKQLSKYPTRIMSYFLDDETFYNGENIASVDPKNNNTQSGTLFPDFKKYYASQSISRSLLLGNQQLNITIHGNLTLRAGDKVNILLPKFSVESKKEDTGYDKQHSGTYLIKDISYEFHRMRGDKANSAITNITLIRDSFGLFTLDV